MASMLEQMAAGSPTATGAAPMMGTGSPMRAAPMAPFQPPPGWQPRDLKLPGEDEQAYAVLANPKVADGILIKRYKDLKKVCLDGREILEADWMRKVLYMRDRQWIKRPTGDSRGGWQDKRLASWIPMPVTNKLKEGVESICSMLAGIDPDAIARPNGQDPKNILTAQTADEIQPSIKEDHEIVERFWDADWWAATLGTTYFFVYWDADDPSHREWVTYQQCVQCQQILHPLDVDDLDGQCGFCGGRDFAEALDPGTQEPLGEFAILGKGKTEVVSEFELLYPTIYQKWEDVDRLIFLRWRPKWYYDGKPYARTLRFQASPAERTMQLYTALALMTTMPLSRDLGSTPTESLGVLEAEVWEKPNAEYPKGLWYRVIDNGDAAQIVIRDEEHRVQPGPLPYQTPKGEPLWTWVQYTYGRTGGRVHGDSALDGAINKQDQLNRNDSMIELTMQRMANPMWLEPKGAEVERFTGAPGLIARYSVIGGAPNSKPERIPGEQPPPAAFTLRNQHIQDIEAMMGTYDVLKGERPPSVEAFSALQLLKEMSQGRFTRLFKTRGKAYRDWYKLALELERTYGPQKRVKAIMGANRSWTFRQFKQAELQGDVSIMIEDGTNAPKTTLGKRAAFEHAKQAGIFNPADPEQLHAGAQILGVPEIIPGIDANVRAAQQEQEQYEQWVYQGRQPLPPPMPVPLTIVYPWESAQVHVQQHDLWANSDRIKRLMEKDPMVAQEIAAHRMLHMQALLMKQAQEQGGAAAAAGAASPDGADGTAPQTDGSAPGERGTGAGGAMASSNAESGATDTLPTSARSGSPTGAA